MKITVKTLCCILESNIILYMNYTSIIKNQNDKDVEERVVRFCVCNAK